MWENIVGIINFLGPIQVLILIIATLIAIVFFIGDWEWGKHGYDPKWLESRRKDFDRSLK